MLALVAPLFGFVLGLAFAWAAIEELSSDPTTVLGSRCLLISTLFSVLVFAPTAGYFMAFHGDWSFAYLANTERLPSAVILALILLDVVTIPLGFAVGAPLVRRKHIRQWLVMAGVPSFVALVIALLLARRLGVSASYTQYHGDFGVTSVAGTALGYAIVWMNGILALAIALTVRKLRAISLATRLR